MAPISLILKGLAPREQDINNIDDARPDPIYWATKPAHSPSWHLRGVLQRRPRPQDAHLRSKTLSGDFAAMGPRDPKIRRGPFKQNVKPCMWYTAVNYTEVLNKCFPPVIELPLPPDRAGTGEKTQLPKESVSGGHDHKMHI